MHGRVFVLIFALVLLLSFSYGLAKQVTASSAVPRAGSLAFRIPRASIFEVAQADAVSTARSSAQRQAEPAVTPWWGCLLALLAIPVSIFLIVRAGRWFQDPSSKWQLIIFGVSGLGYAVIVVVEFFASAMNAPTWGLLGECCILCLMIAMPPNLFLNASRWSVEYGGYSTAAGYEWRYAKSAGRYGPATRKDVYEHHHGYGSWEKSVSSLKGAISFFRFCVCIAAAAVPFLAYRSLVNNASRTEAQWIGAISLLLLSTLTTVLLARLQTRWRQWLVVSIVVGVVHYCLSAGGFAPLQWLLG